MMRAASISESSAVSLPFGVLFAGVLSLVIPTFYRLATEIWTTEGGIHGPIVLATGIWLIARRWQDIQPVARTGSLPLTLVLLLPTLLLYIGGRAFDFLSVEVAMMLGTLIILAYYYFGPIALRMLWFPIFYLLFLVPLPGWFIDYITAPLKEFASLSAEKLLSYSGINIVRQGVTLYVDQYQLLVKDACAGLNSLFSLISISLFYVYLLHNASWRYAGFLILWIIPVAIFANIMRIIILVLITHFFGEAAAQGFLHSTAGLLMFAIALLGIFLLDHIFSFIYERMAGRPA